MLETIIQSIDAWMQANSANYTLFFVIIGVILALGFAMSWIISKKIGKSDERSDFINLRIGYLTLGTGWVSTIVFVSSLVNTSVEYASQLVLIPLSFTVLAGALISLMYYIRNK